MSHAIHRLPLGARSSSRLSVPASKTPHQPSTDLVATRWVLNAAEAAGDDCERADAAFISATRLYEDCLWAFAFERLSLLADQGHTPAAKLALLMLRYGSALYGTNFVVHPVQVARWAQCVLRSARAKGSPN